MLTVYIKPIQGLQMQRYIHLWQKFGHESVIATYLRLGKRQVQRPEDGPLQEPLAQDEVEARLNCNSDCDDRTSRGRQRPRQRQR